MKTGELIGRIKFGAKKNAPELLLGTALVTGTACIITTGKAACKAKTIMEVANKDKTDLMMDYESGIVTEDDFKKEVTKHYSRLALSLMKEYAIPATLYAATVACVFGTYKVQKNRQVALSTALAACTTAYNSLVKRLKDGAEHGLTAKDVLEGKTVVERINPETGEITKETVQGEPVTGVYNFRFDKYSTAWERDHFQNECTLISEQNWANDKLRLEGFVFLNDILERLGLPKTKAGQIVGWRIDGKGDGFVDFGMKDCSLYEDERFDENAWDLDFNCDGDILTRFKDIEYTV